MSDFDIFPTLDEPATAGAIATKSSAPAAPAAIVGTIKAAVLSQFKATEPVLQALVKRYENVAIDVSTPKGLADAKAARHDLRENGRFVVQRARDAIKGEVNALKPLLESEADRLIAIVQPVEDQYDAPIKAREAELAAEKQAREEKEAARVAAHRANIAKLAGYVTQAQGKTSAQILTIINGVSGIDILPEQWEEFAVGAEVQKAETLEALQALFDRTKTAEEEAAAREAQRIENERVAAELAEAKRVMAVKQAELDRQLAEIAAAKQAAVDAEADDVRRIWEGARRIEGNRVGYVLKAQGNFESGAGTYFANDQRPAIVAALRDARAEMQDKMREAEQRETQERDAEALRAAQADEDEANRLAREVAADALQVATDSTPADVVADAYAEKPAPAADMEAVTAQAWALPTGPVTFSEPPPPAADEEPTLTLGAINARFGAGFTMTAAFVTDVLGVSPAGTKKAAVLFRPSQLTAICDALVALAGTVCEA